MLQLSVQSRASTPVSIELSQPLGQRTIYDGLYVPPKPLGEDTEIE